MSANLANIAEFAATRGLNGLKLADYRSQALHTGDDPQARPELLPVRGRRAVA